MKNTTINISVPNAFLALNVAFKRLSLRSNNLYLAIAISLCLVMLYDNGLLPEYPENSRHQLGFQKLLHFALNFNTQIPDYTESFWNELWLWTQKFILEHTNLTLPNEGIIGKLTWDERYG